MTLAIAKHQARNRFVALAIMLLVFLLVGMKTAYSQSECEANFKVSGDPRNGASYLTYVTIPHLDIHSALGQVEKAALDGGLAPVPKAMKGMRVPSPSFGRTRAACCIRTKVSLS